MLFRRWLTKKGRTESKLINEMLRTGDPDKLINFLKNSGPFKDKSSC